MNPAKNDRPFFPPFGLADNISPLAVALQKAVPGLSLSPGMNTVDMITHICTDQNDRIDLQKLGAEILPFANAALISTLIDLSTNCPVANRLLDVLMLSLMRDQHQDKDRDPAVQCRLTSQPFVFSIDNNEVSVFPERTAVPRLEFYRIWVATEGNPHHMLARVFERYNHSRQIPPHIQPVWPLPVFTSHAGDVSYRIRVLNRADFCDKPEVILSSLCDQFDKAVCDSLRVTYANERGEDAGGLRRQFVCDLFSNISKKLQFQQFENGLFRPRCRPGTEFPVMNANDTKTCQDLGKLIMFCLNAAEEYPTGLIFDLGTFVALLRMDPNFLNLKFEEIDFNDPATYASMFGVYKAMNRHDETECKNIDRMERYLALTAASPDQALKDAYGSVMAEDAIEKLNIDINNIAQIKQHLETIKAAVKNAIIDNMKASFAPIHAIATGMKSSKFGKKINFPILRNMRPVDLSKLLQGLFSKREIISRLTFAGGEKANIVKTWFTNWINKSDERKLELFLYAATGSSTLDSNSRISVVHKTTFTFSTSSRQIGLNFDMISNEEDLKAFMEAHLDLIKNDPGFNIV